MSKKIKNKNCPLQEECERKCEHIGSEENCDYYKNNNVNQHVSLSELLNPDFDDDDDYDDTEEFEEDEFVYTEEVTGKIVQIPIKLLHHHHDNPRKEIGDISELTDSIKAKGILQNLTVVPFWFKTTGVGCDDPKQQAEMGYLVVIGNRRLEAAKAAGLKTLPCIIAKMTQAEQVQTMLLENMQRTDLTVYEQAQGFQMMIDFGDTVDTVAEKTGFSKTTIRRRLKMAELDAEKLKKASTRQLSLDDLDRLGRIEDIEKRNELLDIIGTSNFEYSYKQAITRQEEEKNCEAWRAVLLEKGLTEISYNDVFGNDKYRNSARPYATCSSVAPSEFVIDEDMQFFAFNRGTVYFRRERNVEDDEKSAAYQREQEKERERKNALDEITKRAYELRKEFVESVTETTAKKVAPVVIEYNVQKDWSDVDNYGWNHGYDTNKFPDRLSEVHGIEAISQQITDTPFRTLLRHTYVRWSDGENCGYTNYRGDWVDNKRLNFIYEFLVKLGYEISDEERSMMDGTNALFGEVESDEEEDEILEAELIEDEDPADEDEISEDDTEDDDILEKLRAEYGGENDDE